MCHASPIVRYIFASNLNLFFSVQPKNRRTTTASTAATAATPTTSATRPRGERRKPGKGKPVSTPAPATTEDPSGPDSSRVTLDSGNVRFLCKVSLSPNERAVITVRSRLFVRNLLKLHKNAAQFRIVSGAEFGPNESFRVEPSGSASVASVAKVKDPMFQQGSSVHLKSPV